MISKRVASSQPRKKAMTPMTPSQLESAARLRCQARLVVSELDSSTETSSKDSCSCLAVARSLPRRVKPNVCVAAAPVKRDALYRCTANFRSQISKHGLLLKYEI